MKKATPMTEDRASQIRYWVWNGVSQAEVAEAVGVSPELVSRIVNGTWKPRERVAELPASRKNGPKARCPGCGHMIVYWPCLGCKMERS